MALASRAHSHGPTWPCVRTTTGRCDRCRRLFVGLETHLGDGALGTLGEVFDGDAPHSAGGAPAQAWSVGQALQVLALDLDGTDTHP